jgi:uncharacterized membrane protein
MATTQGENNSGGGLKGAFQDTLSALGERAMHSASQRVSGLTDKLTGVADGGGFGTKVVAKAAEAGAQGDSPVKGAVAGAASAGKDKIKDALTGGKGGGKNPKPAATKAMNFVEHIDVGVPVRVAYNQWTQYRDWPSFMKKVEHAEQEKDTPKVNMKAQVFWFHRDWESTIIDQIPDERIVWRSKGRKGHIDGCVTFHELAPRLTRILIQLEYYPQGFIERIGNIWRAAGRRARLEIKHFRRHVMMNVILNPDEVEGWRGEIEEREVIRTHDEVVEEEQRAAEEEEQENQEGEQGEESEGQEGQGPEDQPEDQEGEGPEDQEGQESEDQEGEGSEEQAGGDQGDQDRADEEGEQFEGDQAGPGDEGEESEEQADEGEEGEQDQTDQASGGDEADRGEPEEGEDEDQEDQQDSGEGSDDRSDR